MSAEESKTRAEIARARFAQIAAEFERRSEARQRAALEAADEPGPRFSFRLDKAHLAVIAAVLAACVGVIMLWGRSNADSATGEEFAVVAPEPSASAASDVVVDVAGKVKKPGIVTLPHGSRVVDALEAAGGARRGVDTSALNLARVLNDGEQIVVGIKPPKTDVQDTSDDVVSLNSATASQLESLPGVGPVTAAAILAWRDENGGFKSVDDLIEVSGIGEATLAKLRPLVAP